MIAVAAWAVMQTGNIFVYVKGGSLDSAKALAKYLGPSYSVNWGDEFSWRTTSGFFKPKAALPLTDIEVLQPDLKMLNANPDTYVSTLRSELLGPPGLTPRSKEHYKRFVWVATAEGDTSARTATYLAPLTRQAAREARVKAIEAEAGRSFAETVGDVIADPVIDKKDWRVVSSDSEQVDEGPANNAIDGNPDTYWHTRYEPTLAQYPHQITVDMGREQKLAGFRYVPRQDGGVNGRVKSYAFFVSADGTSWGSPVSVGEFPNVSRATRIMFSSPILARFFRFEARSEQNRGPWATAAEIDVLRVRP